MIAEASTAEFIARSTRSTVRVRSPRLDELASALRDAGITGAVQDGAMLVTDVPMEQIGDVAAAAGLPLHELSAQSGSLEEAFIQLTGGAVEYGTSRATPGGPVAPLAGSPGAVDPSLGGAQR